MSYYEEMLKKAQNLKNKKDIIVLGIESSCDETSISVVKNGREVLSNIIASQIEIHKRFGGVVPEVASRNHVSCINNVYEEAITKANIDPKDIDAVAVTYGAGLIGALLVGVNFAKALAYALNVPLIKVNHIKGHIAANYIADKTLEPPFICLVVSGGHSSIFEVKDYLNMTPIGQTLDDAVGEVFDKVARVVGLSYPGGPNVEKQALNGKDSIVFNRHNATKGTYNFSFSGIKTAVINYVNNLSQKNEKIPMEDICCSFQELVKKELCEKSIMACKNYNYKKLAIAGGVSANKTITNYIGSECEKENIKFYHPPIILCTDNGAMIASEGYYNLINQSNISDLDLNATANIGYRKGYIMNGNE
jgi:N6-L-threonylcarbamoyladenine synthase